jgi:TRAP-type C4-dicarboxylate transport system substrate-binding protein
MGWADVYQGLERGVMEGVAGSIRDFVDQSLGGMVRTLVVPGVFTSDASLVISDHIWSRLDDTQRDAIMSASIDWEKASLEYNRRMWSEAVTVLEAAGTRILELSGAERDKYVARAYDVAWGIAATNDPEMTEILRGFSSH